MIYISVLKDAKERHAIEEVVDAIEKGNNMMCALVRFFDSQKPKLQFVKKKRKKKCYCY